MTASPKYLGEKSALRQATALVSCPPVTYAQARVAEPFGGDFAGSDVVQEVRRMAGQRIHVPSLRILVSKGLIENSGESTRGGRRAYYRMPDRAEVEETLRELPPVGRDQNE
jgi:hypothetical protein